VRGVAFEEFGGPEVLQVRDDLPDPPVGPDTVLVRTHAAGVNPVDLGIREGRLAGAFPHHFPIIPGWELSGVVEAAGPAVDDWTPGIEVIAYVRRDDVQWGATADLVPVPERCLGSKPSSLSFAEAGALPLAGLTAHQALTWHLNLAEGDRVLITRGSGGSARSPSRSRSPSAPRW
jgi:NADPH:quinone reductase-like Zn-dependent oxidoreductase